MAQYLHSMKRPSEELPEEEQSHDQAADSGNQGGQIIEGEYEEVDEE